MEEQIKKESIEFSKLLNELETRRKTVPADELYIKALKAEKAKLDAKKAELIEIGKTLIQQIEHLKKKIEDDKDS